MPSTSGAKTTTKPASVPRDSAVLGPMIHPGEMQVLRQFPSVRREQAIEALEFARETLLTSARPS